MRADEAKVIADFLLATLESEIGATTGVFGAVPADKLAYCPDPRSMSALALLRHITLEDEWFLNAIADGEFTAVPDASDVCAVMTPADAVTRYQDRIPAAIARVRALSGVDLLREVDLLGMVRMPALNFLSLTLRHSAHHRGQLSAYLRPMGAKVPPIYGPSADTQIAAA